MNKQELITKYEKEVAVQKERLASAKKKVEELGKQLGLSEGELTLENVQKLHDKLSKEVSEKEKELEALIDEYEGSTEE